MLSLVLLTLSVLSFIAYSLASQRKRRNQLPLPPGPPKLPLVGNLFSMPKDHEWETYHKWAIQYDTDIVQVSVGPTSLVILDTEEVARDLLDRRSSIYSSRPITPLVHDLMGWSDHFGLMRYGEEWRKHRRTFHREFHVGEAPRFRSVSLNAARRLLEDLHENPNDVMAAFNYMAPAAILSITYGIETRRWDDPYISLNTEATHTLSGAAVPGAFLVNSIPALRHVPEWFPGSGFKTKAREWFTLRETTADTLFAAAKRNANSPNPRPSFVSYSLQRLESSKRAEDLSAYEQMLRSIGTTVSTAAADPIASALGNLVLALLKHPEVQATAQAEIDQLLKQHRLPEFEDMQSLPYVTALVKEVLRTANITPIGVPHFLEVEDEYRGFRIPAGSVVIYNQWAILHDERVYPEPFFFKPERHLENGVSKANYYHDTTVFGFGRRICPGQHVGFDLLWISVASLISVFDFQKAVDDTGRVVEPVHDHRSIIVNTPESFKCVCTPRYSAAEALINADG